jgi:hypothetical protein
MSGVVSREAIGHSKAKSAKSVDLLSLCTLCLSDEIISS